MPLHLEPRDVAADLEGVSSALLVSCPVCPPVSLAIRDGSPVIELFRHGLKTGAFQEHLRAVRESLEERGIRTGNFCIYAPLPMMCLWTRGQRNRLLKCAKDYDAVLVMGCDSATCSVQQALESTGCRVVPAMRTVGVANATAKFRLPMTIDLEGETRVLQNGDMERARASGA